MITEADEEALSSLSNVKCNRLEDKHSFKLEFEFGKNSFFTNPVLCKTFYFTKVDCGVDHPCSTNGGNDCSSGEQHEEFYRFDRMEGSNIDWLPGSNLTVKMVKKTQRHKSKNITRVVEREENVDSFFNFFGTLASPLSCKNEDNDSDHEPDMDNDEVSAHLEIGDLIRGKIIPDAVNWFLGIAEDETAPFDDEDDVNDYEVDGSNDDEEGDAEEDDEEEELKPTRHATSSRKPNQDCKQQ